MDSTKVWKKVLELIKAQIQAHNFRAWFGSVKLKQLTEEGLTISTPSAFISEQLNLRYLTLVEEVLKQTVGKKIMVRFVVDSSQLPHKQGQENHHEEDLFIIDIPSTTSSLNPKYTLENFVVGPSNNVAFAGAQAVVQNPGISYNPLFVYGGTGVGKTHLMIGIGNAILRSRPHTKTIYCSSEQFMNDYVSAIQNHKMADLRAKYRSTHILLIDDVQFFSGREGTQEEFFHTFNELQSKNSQMVITSDRPPSEIAKLEDRLRSRFAGGLMVDIQPPDFDTRVAILKAKPSEWGSVLPDDSLKLIASSTDLSIRELEGKLLQIIQTLKTQNLSPVPQNIARYLNKAPVKKPSPSYAQVISAICKYFNLSTKDLTGPRRQKELVLPRHLAMYILSEELGLTVEKIGASLGGRDHTTVMHGRNKIRQLVNKDREIHRMLIEIRQGLST